MGRRRDFRRFQFSVRYDQADLLDDLAVVLHDLDRVLARLVLRRCAGDPDEVLVDLELEIAQEAFIAGEANLLVVELQILDNFPLRFPDAVHLNGFDLILGDVERDPELVADKVYGLD